MTVQTIRILIAGVLFLHGIAHIGPIGTYIWLKYRPNYPTDGWIAARFRILPSLTPRTAAAVATVFWSLSLVGFVAAALSFRGVLVPGELWRPLAIASAVISSLGIVLFFGTWPMFNTLAALAVNAVVLLTLLWLHWPPLAMFGK